MRRSDSLRVCRSASSRVCSDERVVFAEGGAMATAATAGALPDPVTSATDRGKPAAGGDTLAAPLSSANRTPQLGHWSASAGTDALHTGHSYSVAAPSENSAPQPGHTVASAATRVSHTGQRNFSPSSRAVDIIDAESEAAAVSPDSGVWRATLFNDSMISRWSSLPSMIEARISSMLRPSLTGTSTGSCGPPARSNSVRSGWHEGHTRAAAPMDEPQTGQTYGSVAGVGRHLDLSTCFQSLTSVQRLSGLSPA